MTYGYRGKFARINLTTETITIEKPEETFYKQFLGGRNIAGWVLNNEVSGDCDPLSEDNKIIVATSVLTGTTVPGASRFTLAAKSPLTEGYGDSEAGGFFGPELKFAGYDALIIEGRASKPSYIMIKDDKIEIMSAEHLWGKDTYVVQELIREDHEDPKIRVLQTGKAGENLARNAAVTNECRHWNGRCGLGAVFGSKNLRAIAVRGTQKVPVNDNEKIKAITSWYAKNIKNNEGYYGFSQNGTPSFTTALDGLGILPTKNFVNGSFENVNQISGEIYNDKLLVKRESCWACPIRCKRVVEYKSDKINIDINYGGPEYESIGALGPICEIDDLVIISKANELCGRYGLDTIGVGVTIAFAMECYEKGLITKEDTDGLELTFGNGEALLTMIEKIANREGFGDLLAEGSYRASLKIGKGSTAFAMVTKKQEFPAHEPRPKWNVGLGYAVSITGADHLVVAHDHAFENDPVCEDILSGMDLYPLYQFGIREPLPRKSLSPKKVRLFIILQYLWSLYNVLDLCNFIGIPERRMVSLEQLVQMVNGVTGWDLSLYELIQAGEKGIVMGRLFNYKCGITSEQETLPERMFEPLGSGVEKGSKMDRTAFYEAKDLYYQMIGCDVD